MRMADLSKWIAILLLGVVSLYVFRPRAHSAALDVRGFETFALARSLAEHRGFSDPFQAASTGPSAHIGPLYPAYVALIMRLFGTGALGARVLAWLTLLILILQLMLLPVLAQQLGLGFWSGLLAASGWLAAGIPPILTSESGMAALLAVCATFLMYRALSRKPSRSEIILSGLLWGLLLLLQPVVLAVLPCWVLLLHFRSQDSWRQKIALLLLPLVVVTPWIVRNWLVFHQPVFIRDNLGLELSVSNNPCATPLFEANDANGCFGLTHPNLNYDEAMKMQQLGEVQYNRVRMREALAWIAGNPSAFATLSAERFVDFWVPPPGRNKGNGIVWRPWVLDLVTLLSIPGLIFMWKNARRAAYVIGLWLVFFPPIYYIIQFMDRYRYPIFWATFLAAGYFVTEVAGAFVGNKVSETSDAKAHSEPVISEEGSL